ncbi:MAG: helix-turn-helix domain-containing protein, partial [Bacteroidales bacterium]|nr:helix-turn-helix domain-containing protein [Bacteroidales bacterium]
MRHHIYIMVVVAIVLVLAGCKGGGADNKRAAQAVERLRVGESSDSAISHYTAAYAMTFVDTEPERALQLIDSARLAGNLSDVRADIQRARVYGRSHAEIRTDSAILIGERLMRHDSVMADYDLQIDVLEILLDAYRLERDYEQALHWATRLSDVYREHDMRHLQSYSNAEIGALMVRIGQQQEGLARIDSAVQQLAGHRHYTEMNLALLALKRKADVAAETGRYQATTDAAQQMLAMLDDFEQHPADYYDQGNSYSGITVEERPRYIDFYRSRAYSFLALAAASQHQPQQAIHYLDLYGQTDASQTLHGRYVTTPTLCRLGRYDRMLAIYDEVEQSMADDTLNANYADILRGRAEVAQSQGHPVAANGYWRRYADLSQQLSDSLLRGKAHLFAARYHAQEQQREIEQQRAGKRIADTISIATGSLALLILAFALYAFRQWRITQQRNRILAQQITEAVEYKEKYRKLSVSAEPSVHSAKPELAISDFTELSDEQLFLCLRDLIENEQLFLQPDFGRQSLIDRTGLSKERIGAAFAQGSDSVSLPAYVRELRLDYAIRLLNDQPDLTVEQVSQASGFTSADTFTRNFRAK